MNPIERLKGTDKENLWSVPGIEPELFLKALQMSVLKFLEQLLMIQFISMKNVQLDNCV